MKIKIENEQLVWIRMGVHNFETIFFFSMSWICTWMWMCGFTKLIVWSEVELCKPLHFHEYTKYCFAVIFKIFFSK